MPQSALSSGNSGSSTNSLGQQPKIVLKSRKRKKSKAESLLDEFEQIGGRGSLSDETAPATPQPEHEHE